MKKLIILFSLAIFPDAYAYPLTGFFSKFLGIKQFYNKVIPQETLYWNWKEIDVEQPNFLHTLNFPSSFLWGVADSAYQVEGPYSNDDKRVANNWTEWEEKESDDNQKHHIVDQQKVGHACDRWNRYKEDIQLMKDCGFKIYRFSIEWSKIEPKKGKFDIKAMQHYIDVVDELNKQGIEPVVCLFHHTWPLWFDVKSAWEQKENIHYFVDYAKYVFKHLHDKVKIWMTINEPVGFAMGSYYTGANPPGKRNLALCGQVVLNLLEAHVKCYKKFKAIDKDVQIGLPHVIQHLDAYHRFNVVEQMAASIFDYLVNDALIDYFNTGKFRWGYPWKTMVSADNEDAIGALDYIGVNYYSHTNICMQMNKIFHPKELITPQPRTDKDEILTGNLQIIYPEGLYRAIVRCAKLGKPMYVAENGLADNEDKWKNYFIKTHLYAVSKAIKDGYDVRGYFYWTLMDNWEWSEGYSQKFGLFKVNFDTQERIIYPGAQEFITFLQQQLTRQELFKSALLIMDSV